MTGTSPATATLPAAPRRRRRWRTVLGIAVLLLVAAWFFVLPPVASAVLVAQLRDAGWRDVTVGALEVSLDRIDVRDLRASLPGVAELHAPTTTASVRLADLLARRVDSLVVEGAHVKALAGPRDDDAPKRASATTTGPRALPDLPVGRIELRDTVIELPAAAGSETVRLDVRLTRDGARWDLLAIAASAGTSVQCTARCTDEGATAHGPVSIVLAGETPLAFAGEVRLVADANGRTLHAALARTAGSFAFAWRDIALRGDGGLAITATVPFAQLAATTLGVRSTDLRLEQGEARIEGVDTELAFAGWPVVAGAQRVQWRRASFADMTGGSGSLVFEVRPGWEVLAELKQHAADELGSIAFREVRLTPGIERIAANVVIARLPLREWLELLSKGRVTGEGRVGGEIDVVVALQPRFDLEVRGGQVAAEPGGVVRFLEDAETEAMIREHARQVASASEHKELVQERIVGALKKFAFDALDFRIVRAELGESTLQVHAAGKGVDVPQGLDLTVNLHGFDAALDTALALKFGLDRARDASLDQPASPPESPKEPTTSPPGQRNR